MNNETLKKGTYLNKAIGDLNQVLDDTARVQMSRKLEIGKKYPLQCAFLKALEFLPDEDMNHIADIIEQAIRPIKNQLEKEFEAL